MLQNRVDPWGRIISTSARGAWMGNRGLLHDADRQIVRPYRLKAWLICVLEFKGRKRQVMAPHRYTELFFFDEATAFSAGHRPCAECRREGFNRWKTAWLAGNPGYGFHERVSIADIDRILHRERTSPERIAAALGGLPNGCFVAFQHTAYVVADGSIYPWTPFGYGEGIVLSENERVEVLTPGSIVQSFRAGYIPQIGLGPT